MRNISICDISVSRSSEYSGVELPFRTKIEVAKLLSKLGVSVIEMAPVRDGNTDYFLVKSIASVISDSTVSVPIDIMDSDSLTKTWEALKVAAHPRLQVCVPVSAVRMEYVCHKKAADILNMVASNVSACAAVCPDVEFVAEDFGRSDPAFLAKAVSEAVRGGATQVTVADIAGNMLPEEFYDALKTVRDQLPESIRLGVYCSNELYLADACAVAAVKAGADEVKTMTFGNSTVSLKCFSQIIDAKSDVCGVRCSVNNTGVGHIISQINKLCEVSKSKSPTAVSQVSENETFFSSESDIETLKSAIENMGYELTRDELDRVYLAFRHLAEGKSQIREKEIDALVTSIAFQVPATYHLNRFMVNTGNTISPTCQISLERDGKSIESVSGGDGPVDAAFLAIEKVLGRHFEVDDFQISSVTEGREAMGKTVVKLRNDGRVYSGIGVSKDILASSILAYLSALNKIVYEEEQV